MSVRLVVLLVVALLWPAVPFANFALPLGDAPEAQAQVWSPKGKKKKKRKKRRRKKPKPNDAGKKAADKKEGAGKSGGSPALIEEDDPPAADQAGGKAADDQAIHESDDGDDYSGEEIVGDDDDDSSGVDASSGTDGDAGGDYGTYDDDDDDGGDGEAGDSGGESVRIEDDLDNVGADVTFTDADLDTGVASDSSANVTRLETLAMAFARLGVDAVHDAVPLVEEGAKAVGEDVFAFRAHARAEGVGRWGRRFKVKVAGRANADLSLDADTNIGVERYETEMWDTYVDYFVPHLDLRFGKQFVAWGKADLLSPNDVVNARDLRRGFLDRPAELRLPTLALSARAYDGPFSFEALWVPVAPVNRFELLEGDFALLGPNAATRVERRVGALVSALADDPALSLPMKPILDIGTPPDNGIETGEFGAASELRFAKVDLAVYFLWGHERNPRLQLADQLAEQLAETDPSSITAEGIADAINALAQLTPPVSAVTVDYPRRLHFGGAVAGRIEPFGVKLDVGYSPEGNTIVVPPGQGPLLATPMQLPQLTSTVSFDYDRGSVFNFVIEGSYTQIIDVPIDREVFQMDGDRLYLVASQFTWNPRSGPFSFRFLGFVDVSSPSYALQPAVRLSGHDNLSVEIAGTLFGGPEGSYGGVSDSNDEVTLTVQYGL